MPLVGDSTCPSWDNLTNQVEETLAEQTAGISSHPLREEGRGRPRGTATAAPWSDAGSTECPLLEFSELHACPCASHTATENWKRHITKLVTTGT